MGWGCPCSCCSAAIKEALLPKDDGSCSVSEDGVPRAMSVQAGCLKVLCVKEGCHHSFISECAAIQGHTRYLGTVVVLIPARE
eukprot:220106-Pelagomonas_calceolata.AAC.1